jgi:hypothetical protein
LSKCARFIVNPGLAQVASQLVVQFVVASRERASITHGTELRGPSADQAVQDLMSCLGDTLDDEAAGLAELIRKLA